MADPATSTRVASTSTDGAGPDEAQSRRDALHVTLLAESDRFAHLLKVDDPLDAELRAAQLLAVYTTAGGVGMAGLVQGIVETATRYPTPQVAAMALSVGSLLPGRITTGIATDLVRQGVLLPSWYRRLGMAKPVRAWRSRDVFGDQELVLITFHYGEAEHAIIVETVTCPTPRVLAVQVTTATERARAAVEASTDATGAQRAMEEISLIEARAAVSRAIRRPYREAQADDLVLLPVVRNRVGRLPEVEVEDDDENGYEPTLLWGRAPEGMPSRTDRAAAVEEFLADAGATAGVEEGVLRFWAGALAGYTALTRSQASRIGPVWLDHALGDHVSCVFELTPAQRAALVPAVSAWASWAARKQGLPASAVGLLLRRITELDAVFDDLYADPDLLPLRCYLSDVAARTADGEDLLRAHRQRILAVPPPARRAAGSQHLLASDPEHRRRIHAERIASDGTPDGVAERDWLDALAGVSDRLWDVGPGELTAAVTEHLDRIEVLDRHDYLVDLDNDDVAPDLLDRLAELAIAHPDDGAFLAAVRTGSWAGLG